MVMEPDLFAHFTDFNATGMMSWIEPEITFTLPSTPTKVQVDAMSLGMIEKTWSLLAVPYVGCLASGSRQGRSAEMVEDVY